LENTPRLALSFFPKASIKKLRSIFPTDPKKGPKGQPQSLKANNNCSVIGADINTLKNSPTIPIVHLVVEPNFLGLLLRSPLKFFVESN